MITLPAVRFIRCFDIREMRMVNIWMRVTTQDQLNNAPLATELTVTAQTVDIAMQEIRKRFASGGLDVRWIDAEAISEIEKKSRELVDAHDSVYEVR